MTRKDVLSIFLAGMAFGFAIGFFTTRFLFLIE